MSAIHIINKPCGHSYAQACECAGSGFTWTSTGTSFLWNGPLKPRNGGGYEPDSLRMAGSLRRFDEDDDTIIRGRE